MWIINNSYVKPLVLVLVLCAVFSCSKSENSSNLDTTIFVRHKDADMPAYIHGNATENIFLIMLHGGPSGIGLSYRGQAFDNIEKTCAVVYFDQRGSGIGNGFWSFNYRVFTK